MDALFFGNFFHFHQSQAVRFRSVHAAFFGSQLAYRFRVNPTTRVRSSARVRFGCHTPSSMSEIEEVKEVKAPAAAPEPTEKDVINTFQQLRQDVQAMFSKINELENEKGEHTLVIGPSPYLHHATATPPSVPLFHPCSLISLFASDYRRRVCRLLSLSPRRCFFFFLVLTAAAFSTFFPFHTNQQTRSRTWTPRASASGSSAVFWWSARWRRCCRRCRRTRRGSRL